MNEHGALLLVCVIDEGNDCIEVRDQDVVGVIGNAAHFTEEYMLRMNVGCGQAGCRVVGCLQWGDSKTRAAVLLSFFVLSFVPFFVKFR